MVLNFKFCELRMYCKMYCIENVVENLLVCITFRISIASEHVSVYFFSILYLQVVVIVILKM